MPEDRTYKLPPYRVVVAEDNKVLRDLLVQQLSERGHVVAGVAATGLDVVKVVRETHPDVAVIDRGLPVLDGLEASREIAEKAPTAVVLLSGYLSSGDPDDEALEAGAQVFVAKPYAMEELEEALEYAVRRFASHRRRSGLAEGGSVNARCHGE
ncbi:MAG TPA: response regulator [Chloroflexota bacterium]|jgi:DNA-binding response OmpR family regulator